MRKGIILLLAVLLLLCMMSCEDTPTLKGGTAAEQNESVTETGSNTTEGSESETKSTVSWTPFV